MAKTPEFDFRDNYSYNYIINGNMDYWQRNTTFSTPSSGTYCADRWRVGYDGTIGTFAITRQAFTLGQTDVPNNPNYFLRWNQTAAGSGSTSRAISQRIESVRTMAGRSITVSLYLKADTTRVMSVSMFQNFGTGGSPSANVPITGQNITLTTAWQKFTLTFAIPSITGKTIGTNNDDYLSLTLNLPINTTMTIDLAQVMFNEGTDAAPFSYNASSLAMELSACQRYFEKSFDVDFVPAAGPNTTSFATSSGLFVGMSSNTLSGAYVAFKVAKRATPTWVQYGNSIGQYRCLTPSTATVNWTTQGAVIDVASTYGVSLSQQFLASTILAIATHWTAEAEL